MTDYHVGDRIRVTRQTFVGPGVQELTVAAISANGGILYCQTGALGHVEPVYLDADWYAVEKVSDAERNASTR